MVIVKRCRPLQENHEPWVTIKAGKCGSRINHDTNTSSTCQLQTNNLCDYQVQPGLCNQAQLNRAATPANEGSHVMVGVLPRLTTATKHLLCSFSCRRFYLIKDKKSVFSSQCFHMSILSPSSDIHDPVSLIHSRPPLFMCLCFPSLLPCVYLLCCLLDVNVNLLWQAG